MGATVLLYGSGAREHAWAWKLAQSTEVTRLIWVASHIAAVPEKESQWSLEVWNPEIGFEEIVQRAKTEGVQCAVVGPDDPIAQGLCDHFVAAGIPALGPLATGAKLESSKSFAKEIMQAAKVDTAAWVSVTDRSAGERALDRFKSPWVIKADGLALGKGVKICSTRKDASQALETLLELSGNVVIEEFLEGEEVSWMAFCRGDRVALWDTSRDYKRLQTKNLGPNTGGMGAYSPVALFQTEEAFERVRKDVFLPVLHEMKKRGTPFHGILYAGLIFNSSTQRLSVLEFNARLGDPEAQVLLPRMKDDLWQWVMRVATGEGWQHDQVRVGFHDRAAVYVVGAAEGYPDAPVKGDSVSGWKWKESLRSCQDPSGFVAGMKEPGVTSGGRVLGALGQAPKLEEARALAYQRLETMRFRGMQNREDVGVL